MANNFKTIYVLKFNNYYNRILKHYDTLNEYLTAATEYESYLNINFNPNDGVNTDQVLNQATVDITDMDYVLVVEPTYNTIESRWFILKATRTRLGQYQLNLKRDLVADNYENLLNSPMFIEKASVNPSDPAIYNSEDMTFNEIKTKETLLKDSTNTPWIALYFAQGLSEDISGTVNVKGSADIDLTSMTHTAWTYYNLNNDIKPTDLKISVAVSQKPTAISAFTVRWATASKYEAGIDSGSTGSNDKYGYVPTDTVHLNIPEATKLLKSISTTTYDITGIINQLASENNWIADNDIENYNGKLIAFSDGYFRCTVTSTASEYLETDPSQTVLTTLKNNAEASFATTGVSFEGPYHNAFKLRTPIKHLVVTLVQESTRNAGYTYTIKQGHNKTEDQPFDICLLPLESITLHDSNLSPAVYNTKKEVSLLVAKDIIEKNKGSNKLIDAQIVPYFPELGWVVAGHVYKIDLDRLVENENYNRVTTGDSTAPESIIFYASKAAFRNRIGVNYIGDTDVIGKPATEYKVRLECDKYRLCSPNYNGIFEFSPIKAGYVGAAINFDVDCTYMPMTPFIQIYPVFKAGSLYGGDFNDARGLTCGGDFSMAQSSDQWATYQAQHKNYQVAFNREIENIEIHNKYQAIGEIAASTASTISAAVNGGQMGKAGTFSGAGAVLAAGVSGGAGATDFAIAEKLRQENLDFKRDQFGYQLGNIKALPDSLVKTTAYTINNKYFPFVEYYTCTDIEKDALRNKIKYNGMTVMRIGTINEFLTSEETYIKGKLIRLENSLGDAYEVMALADELNQGLFMKG